MFTICYPCAKYMFIEVKIDRCKIYGYLIFEKSLLYYDFTMYSY
jgi:hypothetical protein